MLSSQRAFESSVAPHLHTLRALAWRLTKADDRADDLMQETLIRAWNHWDRLQASDANVRAWLRRVMVNKFISQQRHRKVVTRTAARPDLVDHLVSADRRRTAQHPETIFMQHHKRREIVSALDALDEPFRSVITMVDVRGWSYKEAAKALECPLGTVMSRLHRGRARMRAHLQSGPTPVAELLC